MEVLVPPLGQTVDTMTLLGWYKAEGSAVQQGEPLFVIETYKASLDVEAPATGILRRVTAQPGDQVKVLSAIAVIEAKVKAKDKGETGSTSTLVSSSSRLFISPRARRLAESAGVTLAAVKATGPEGAIIERDIRAYLAQREQGSGGVWESGSGGVWESGSEGAEERERRGAEERERRGAEERERRGAEERERRGAEEQGSKGVPLSSPEFPPSSPEFLQVPFSGARAIIAERMAASHQQTAAVTLTAEADATALVELRRQLAADGVAVSYNDLFLRILAKALTEHPRLNAWLAGDALPGAAGRAVVLRQQIDIGLAVDAERGLVAPVVRDVAHKGLGQLAAETAELVGRARAGRCTPDELRGSSFTLTNLGMFGIDAFTPIINLPECAILGVGRIKERPAMVAGQVVGRQMVWLSLTFDHRVVDGGPAARFLQRVVQLVEKPHLLLA